MTEHDRARAIATNAGLGEYVRFACPAYSGEWAFFAPLGGFFAWGGTMATLHIVQGSDNLADRILAPLTLTLTVALTGICLYPVWQRRPGGPAPRLHCFRDGVVVARRGHLQPHRWTDLTLRRAGNRRILTTSNGRVLAVFHGNEPLRAGYQELDRLHEAAIARRPTSGRSVSP